MTLEEAIKQLEFDRQMILFDPLTGEEITPEMLKLKNKENYLTYVADGVAIEALKEVQQYRLIKNATIGDIAEVLKEFSEIGTVEECREAVEKAKPKKIQYESRCRYNDGFTKYQMGQCPVCGEWYKDMDEYIYCTKCGQAILW